LPKSSLPAAVSVLPLTVKIESVPSERFATSESVPAGLIETPAAPPPASRVWVTAGGLAFRSITESLSSGTSFFGSAGSTFIAPVTSAKDSSFDTATLCGGPTTLVGAFTSPRIFRGDTPMSTIVTVSGPGLAGTVFWPSTSAILPSLADTAIWACAAEPNRGRVSADASAVPRMRLPIMCVASRARIVVASCGAPGTRRE